MNSYKCPTHNENMFCPGCIEALIARHDHMLGFINFISDTPIFSIMNHYDSSLAAKKLLKEIGELPNWSSDTLSIKNGAIGELTEG